MQDEKLIGLLQEKKAQLEAELKTIMKKKLPLWRIVDQENMINKIFLVLEGLKTN